MLLNLDWQEFKYNEEVIMMIKPLDFPSYQSILSVFRVTSPDGLTEEMKNEMAESFNPMTNPKMSEILKDVLPKHVKDLKGLQLQIDGVTRDATIDDIVNISQCVIISTNIMMRLFNISTIVGAKRTEGKKQSLDSSGVTG